MMRHFRMTLEYDGTDFAGYQYQVGQRSVQDELEQAIAKITCKTLRITGAGRTDAGVHALGQVISFSAATRIPIERFPISMNCVLPPDIRITSAQEVEVSFNARFSARSRKYIYVILNREAPSALFGRYTWHLRQQLDLAAMQNSARQLVGVHDFTAWANSVKEVQSTVREMKRIEVRSVRQFVLIHVEANAFLKGMVRNIVGTLVDVGVGKRSPNEIEMITHSCDRANAGPCAPARGLCLVRVCY